MNGAESLVKSLLASGVTTIFANPGTPEMHFVAALDQHPDMRCILCLFEGGASGAADGYFRMSGQVAATLLHLAPGFGNAFANLHNAAKAGSRHRAHADISRKIICFANMAFRCIIININRCLMRKSSVSLFRICRFWICFLTKARTVSRLFGGEEKRTFPYEYCRRKCAQRF